MDDQDAAAIIYLHNLSKQPQDGVKMKGRVRPIAIYYNCPICEKPFIEYPRLGYVCKEHQTHPRKFMIDIWVQKRHTYFTDEKGKAFDSYGTALDFLEKINDDIKSGTFKPEKYKPEDVKKYHLRVIWNTYKETAEFSDGYQANLKAVEKHIFDYFKPDTDIRTIDAKILHGYLHSLIKAIPKIDTCKIYARYLISCLNAQQHLTLQHHTMPLLGQAVAIKARGQRRQKYIPEIAEVTKILSCVMNEKFRLMFKFNLLHQIRLAELRAIKMGDINFTDETITIQRSAGIKSIREYPKNGEAYTRPLHPLIIDELKAICVNLTPTDFVFAKTTKGLRRIYTHVTLHNMWDDARKDAGLPHVQLYSGLKHSGASEIANASGDYQNTNKLMGKAANAKSGLLYMARRDMKKMREQQAYLVLPKGD